MNSNISSSVNGSSSAGPTEDQLKKQRQLSIGLTVGGVIIAAIVIGFMVFLLQSTTDTAKIRDSFIILMSLELLLIGLTLGLLIIQITKLINLMQNEIKPLLQSANETINTVRGTANFLSDSFVEPVIKMNSAFTSIKKVLDLFNLKNL